MNLHQSLAQGRWGNLTLAEQLGNVGSEFARASAWLRQGDNEKALAAADRFFELIDLTVADPRWKNCRRRELARVRECAAEELQSQALSESLQNYFDQFAWLARTKR
jgi:hypothetical protein